MTSIILNIWTSSHGTPRINGAFINVDILFHDIILYLTDSVLLNVLQTDFAKKVPKILFYYSTREIREFRSASTPRLPPVAIRLRVNRT